ncbi:hypothetical protein [Conservatibacter flavescens]|uniref:Uncharacterized protein n=1 Tax=Conservatibacter flavescens TaxID=28161 RepID=A0A2M8S4X5_9PAST|nr:hypothetical protein [Conservatibacter flavescens]PJG86187.1 hypothetical protein CVP05_03180 [Conservatibacter flavescens]
MKNKQIYAVYKGEKFIFDGTVEDVAETLGIKVASVRKLATPSQQARSKTGITIVKLGAEDDADESV